MMRLGVIAVGTSVFLAVWIPLYGSTLAIAFIPIVAVLTGVLTVKAVRQIRRSSPAERDRMGRALVIGATLAGTTLAVLSGTLLAPSPEKLPAIALESEFLFHAELTVASFFAFLLFITPLRYGLRGELPIEFTRAGLRYAEKDALSQQALSQLTNEVAALGKVSIQSGTIIAELAAEVAALENRVDSLKPWLLRQEDPGSEEGEDGPGV